jgi:hypothetical protein
MQTIGHDIRYGLRGLRKPSSFTVHHQPSGERDESGSHGLPCDTNDEG